MWHFLRGRCFCNFKLVSWFISFFMPHSVLLCLSQSAQSLQKASVVSCWRKHRPLLETTWGFCRELPVGSVLYGAQVPPVNYGNVPLNPMGLWRMVLYCWQKDPSVPRRKSFTFTMRTPARCCGWPMDLWRIEICYFIPYLNNLKHHTCCWYMSIHC